jgi:hypothetical protein
MDIQTVLQLDLSEHEDAQDRVEEEEQEEKSSNIGQLRYSPNESIEQDPQTFVLLNDLKDPGDPKRSNDGSGRSNIQSINAVNDHSNPRSQNNDKVKVIPAIIKVVLLKCDQLDNGLHSVNDVEDQVDRLQYWSEAVGFIVPG